MKYLGAILVVGCLAVAACKKHPDPSQFQEFFATDGTSISVDAHRRAIITTEIEDENATRRTIYCAEPSPDSFMAFSSTLDTSLEAKIKKSGELDADIVDKLSTTASDALSARNSTIQLLRDGFYRACEAYAGGALSGPEYGAIVGQYQHVMLALLSIELLTDINQPKRRPLVLNVDGQTGSTAETPQSNGEENPDPQQSAPSVQENGPSSDNEITWDSLIDAAQAESQGYSRGLSDTSIEVIAATAVRLVERVLRNESARMLQPRLAECMRPTELEGQQAENREKWCDIIVLNITKTSAPGAARDDVGLFDDFTEFVERPSERATIKVGERQRITLRSDEVLRVFDFDIGEWNNYEISVSAQPRGSGDPAFILTTADGEALDSDDDSGRGLDARLERILQVGNYELHVLNVGRDHATFELLIEKAGDGTGTAEEGDDVLPLLEELLEEMPGPDDVPGDDEAAESAQA